MASHSPMGMGLRFWVLACFLVSTALSQLNVNLLMLNSMTRLAGEDLARVTDAPHTLEVLVTAALVNQLNSGNLPVTRTAPYTCQDVVFNLQLIDTVSDFTKTLQQMADTDVVDLDSVDLIVGPSRSSTCIPVSFVTSTSEIPIISASCTSPELDDFQAHRFFSRTIPSDEQAGLAIVKLMEALPTGIREPIAGNDATKQYKRVVVLYQEDTYGSNFKDAIFEHKDEISDFEITFELIPFKPGNPNSLINAVDKAARTKLNVFIGIIFDESFPDLVIEARRRGMMGEGKVWVFTDGIVSATDMLVSLQEHFSTITEAETQAIIADLQNTFLVQATGTAGNADDFKQFQDELFKPAGGYDLEALENLLLTVAQTPDDGTNPANYDEIIALFDNPNAKDFITDFSLFGYDVILTIREFIEKTNCEGDFSGKRFIDTITGDFLFQGLTGSVGFDETGSRASNTAALKLLNARFDTRADGRFIPVDVKVGDFLDRTWDIKPNAQFTGSSISPHFTNPPEFVDRNEIDDTIRGAAVSLAAIVCLIVGFLGFFMYFTSDKQVIKASQPEFLFLMLAGVLISTSSIFIYEKAPLDFPGQVRDDLESGCQTPFYLISIGITISYASLVFKLQRVIRVASFVPDLRDKVQNSMVSSFMWFMLVILLNVLVLLVSFKVDPLIQIQKVAEEDDFGQPEETFDVCSPENNGAIYSLVFIFHVAFYVYGFKLILDVRGLPNDFQEGKWIVFSVVSQFQLFLLGIPIVVAVGEEDPGIRYLVISLLVILSNVILLLLIFGPKVMKVIRGDDNVVWYKESGIKSGNVRSNNRETRETEKMFDVRKSLFNTMGTGEFGGNEEEDGLGITL